VAGDLTGPAPACEANPAERRSAFGPVAVTTRQIQDSSRTPVRHVHVQRPTPVKFLSNGWSAMQRSRHMGSLISIAK
jgi:hypothetical protein